MRSGTPYLNRVFYQHMGVPYSHALPLRNFTTMFPLFAGRESDLVAAARAAGVPLVKAKESKEYFVSPGGAVTLAKALMADKAVLEDIIKNSSIINPV